MRGNKKIPLPERDEILRVTTQFYVRITSGHLMRYAGDSLDTLSLYREIPGCFIIQHARLRGHLPWIRLRSFSPGGALFASVLHVLFSSLPL